MQLCHTPAALSAAFDEPNLIASAGLVPAVALADRIGLRDLVDQWVTVPGSTGCAGAKVMSLVVGMLAGADSIDDMDLLRHGGMSKNSRYSSSTGFGLDAQDPSRAHPDDIPDPHVLGMGLHALAYEQITSSTNELVRLLREVASPT